MTAQHKNGPKILAFDIETSPITAYVWGLFDQNIALNQIKTDWHLLSWSAKWVGSGKVMYKDQRGRKDVTNDKELLQSLWNLLDEADIVLTQNGKSFDVKKVNARFIAHGMKPPSPYKHIDTLRLAKSSFGFTSNKLAYMTDKLCTVHKKLTNNKFGGFDLWKGCLADNIEAWKEMERYNKLDVLSLEELYNKLAPWDRTIDFNLYRDAEDALCNCGSSRLQSRGHTVTTSGKYQRFQCQDCGAWTRAKVNLLNKNKRKSLKSRITK